MQHGLLLHQAVPVPKLVGLCELPSFTIRIFGKFFFLKKKSAASWQAGVWSLGPFCEKKGGSVGSSSELDLVSSGVSLLAQQQVAPPRQCVRRVSSQELWNIVQPVSWCLDTCAMQQVARCLAWVLRTSDMRRFKKSVTINTRVSDLHIVTFPS